jgi:hypothetical protein
MEHVLGIFLTVVLALVAVLILIAIISSLFIKDTRLPDLRALAAARGLAFHDDDPFNLPDVYDGTLFTNEGHDKKASNVIEGRAGEVDVRFFDYEYTVTVTRTRHVPGTRPGTGHTETYTEEETHYKSGCAVHTPLRLKGLFIRPESFFDKAAAFCGFEDIDLDLAEFNKKFYVTSDDKKFAYDVLSQKAMEFLLLRLFITIESAGDFFLFYDASESLLSASDAAALIDTASGFYALLPDYFKKEIQS